MGELNYLINPQYTRMIRCNMHLHDLLLRTGESMWPLISPFFPHACSSLFICGSEFGTHPCSSWQLRHRDCHHWFRSASTVESPCIEIAAAFKCEKLKKVEIVCPEGDNSVGKLVTILLTKLISPPEICIKPLANYSRYVSCSLEISQLHAFTIYCRENPKALFLTCCPLPCRARDFENCWTYIWALTLFGRRAWRIRLRSHSFFDVRYLCEWWPLQYNCHYGTNLALCCDWELLLVALSRCLPFVNWSLHVCPDIVYRVALLFPPETLVLCSRKCTSGIVFGW